MTELVIGVVCAVVTVLGFVFVVNPLRTAGRGSFLKERNDELANALEQMRAQRDDDRLQCEQEIKALRGEVSRLGGIVESLQIAHADIIAEKVLDRLNQAGVFRPRGA